MHAKVTNPGYLRNPDYLRHLPVVFASNTTK
jgi:hypothetical protein